jgi:hypothetical protein
MAPTYTEINCFLNAFCGSLRGQANCTFRWALLRGFSVWVMCMAGGSPVAGPPLRRSLRSWGPRPGRSGRRVRRPPADALLRHASRTVRVPSGASGGAADGSCRPGVVGGRAGRRHKGGPMGTFGLARSSPPLENFWQWSRGTLSFPPAFPAGAAPLSSKELKYLDFLGRVPYPSPSTGESGTNLLLISPNPAPRLRRPQFQRVDGLVSWVSAIRSNADRAQGLRPVSI